MVKIILLIGVQGSGKSWVMSQLIRKHQMNQKLRIGKIRFHTNGVLSVAGVYNGEMFQGSDKLSMAVMSDYDSFLSYLVSHSQTSRQTQILLLEGDRFTNSKVVNHPTLAPHIIKITDDGTLGRRRRGSEQSSEALRRMQTRITNIASHQDAKDSEEALKQVESLIHLHK